MYIMKEVIDIEDFLEYSPQDVEWFQILNGKRPFYELIDKKALLEMMQIEHEKYCNDNGLCSECMGYMERQEQKEEICGSIRTSEVLWVCSRGC